MLAAVVFSENGTITSGQANTILKTSSGRFLTDSVPTPAYSSSRLKERSETAVYCTTEEQYLNHVTRLEDLVRSDPRIHARLIVAPEIEVVDGKETINLRWVEESVVLVYFLAAYRAVRGKTAKVVGLDACHLCNRKSRAELYDISTYVYLNGAQALVGLAGL